MWLVRPTIHKYLAGQVKSQFRRIDADEFTIATLLPVQRFKKVSGQKYGKNLGAWSNANSTQLFRRNRDKRLNDVLSAFHSNEGYVQPNRYEVNLFPPSTGKIGAGSSLQNPFQSVIGQSPQGGDARGVGLRCESVTLPGINLSTIQDSNIYGPTRDIVDGVTYAEEVAMSFAASSDLEERVFFENWQRAAFNPQTWNVGYYNDYIGFVDIYLLDKARPETVWIETVGCFSKKHQW